MADTKRDARRASRDTPWILTAREGASLTIEQLNFGSLLRVADALEGIQRQLESLADRPQREHTALRRELRAARTRATKAERALAREREAARG